MPYPVMPMASFYLTGHIKIVYLCYCKLILVALEKTKLKNSENVNLHDFKSPRLYLTVGRWHDVWPSKHLKFECHSSKLRIHITKIFFGN